MGWMAGRVIQKLEDIAYNRIWIFGAHMVPAYGEEPRAFKRLQEAIVSIHGLFDERCLRGNDRKTLNCTAIEINRLISENWSEASGDSLYHHRTASNDRVTSVCAKIWI